MYIVFIGYIYIVSIKFKRLILFVFNTLIYFSSFAGAPTLFSVVGHSVMYNGNLSQCSLQVNSVRDIGKWSGFRVVNLNGDGSVISDRVYQSFYRNDMPSMLSNFTNMKVGTYAALCSCDASSNWPPENNGISNANATIAAMTALSASGFVSNYLSTDNGYMRFAYFGLLRKGSAPLFEVFVNTFSAFVAVNYTLSGMYMLL